MKRKPKRNPRVAIKGRRRRRPGAGRRRAPNVNELEAKQSAANRKNKSRQKSRARTTVGRFQLGGPQGPGRGPKKGAANAGRPPDEFRRDMRALGSGPEVLRRFRKIITSGSDELFVKAAALLWDRGYGKATQPLEHSGADGGPITFDLSKLTDAQLAKYWELTRAVQVPAEPGP